VVSSSTVIGLAGVTAAVAISAMLQWEARGHVTRAGFWFDEVTFELPHLQAAGLGGPIDQREQAIIRQVARSEVTAAFAAFRIEIGASRDAPYLVRVVQQFPASRQMPFGAAGQSLALAPLGGYGQVSFLMLGSLAITHAPNGATREEIIEGIGRGIGRAAAHEFAHQLLPRDRIHDTSDDRSYEFELAARPAEYYGPIHWDVARPLLIQRLGQR
jgi:hypothetical protein